ncbi:MAG: M23 family metallopeptidase [Bacteroidetes bacterium]|nr:M23 family metallopeptidase [Bacteroidota bacterium]
MDKKTKKERKFFNKLHDKYRLVVMNDNTFEEKISFRLTRFNVFLFFGTLAIFLIVATIYIVAFTPLREYIPGYADFNTRQVLRELNLRADTIEAELIRKDLYILNLQNIISGREIVDVFPDTVPQSSEPVKELPKSKEDSILRKEIESESNYSYWVDTDSFKTYSDIYQFFFFPPVKGLVTNYFNPAENHFGVDIVADQKEAIKATLDGTVIFASWTIETGYTIGIQHPNNLISVYKHNSALLKHIGNYVKAGEVIAIIGESGYLSTGTHLHFELWYHGNPVNPLDYIVF